MSELPLFPELPETEEVPVLVTTAGQELRLSRRTQPSGDGSA